ncbi:hypothetical protein STEG23_027826, partial [Scotinomys teguina]
PGESSTASPAIIGPDESFWLRCKATDDLPGSQFTFYEMDAGSLLTFTFFVFSVSDIFYKIDDLNQEAMEISKWPQLSVYKPEPTMAPPPANSCVDLGFPGECKPFQIAMRHNYASYSEFKEAKEPNVSSGLPAMKRRDTDIYLERDDNIR